MKRLTTIFLISLACSMLSFSQLHPDWENPTVFERNQELPHTTLMPFDKLDQALAHHLKSSPNHSSLNGTWKFHWAENTEQAPAKFFQKGYNRVDWDEIKVPSNWQMVGFGYPLFRNIGLPFEEDPPGVPDEFNPVGSYYRNFNIPATWTDKQVFLHFEGVHSASYVWINGKEVGYNQGGMEPAEYNITRYLRSGENSIAVKVLRYSDGAYMEDQDTWRLSGIYRDVYLMATPGVHIRDYYITTDLDKDYKNATLSVEAEVKNYTKQNINGYSLRVQLYNDSGQPVPEGEGLISAGQINKNSASTLSGLFQITDPGKWSAEYPNLYTLVMELLDESNQVVEILSSRVGFREVEVKNQAIYINGAPIKFSGVNSHMLHPETGHTMDVKTMKKDLFLMKQFNINCVRTSHYPPNVEYLDLADELGIYVVDETGDEAHDYQFISHLPEWREQYLDRMKKMVYRDRNHPSVVIWSAGNESGPGDNLCAIMEEGKRIDPSRPAWMYGGNDDRDPKTNPIKCEDIVGPRYLQPFQLEQLFAKSNDPRPSFMDEYIAVTGNSLGGLDEYWDLIYKYPRLTGGAIWDWISPGITQPVITTPDNSPGNIKCVLMNRAHLTEGESGKALYLSGHDDWLEVSRDPALDISGQSITLSFWIRPEAYNGHAYFLTKGNYQYGIVQSGKEFLEFYIHTGKRVSLKGRLPDDWTYKWHHVAGIYDGKRLELFVDGKIIGTKACQGNIVNGPYRLNIGKSTEIRDSHRGYLCHATIDRVRIFDHPVPLIELQADAADLMPSSLLWLDFTTTRNEGTFYSIGIPGRTYGLIWPDRRIQPELWQLKKSPQPVEMKAIDLERGEIEFFNRHHFRNLEELDATWLVTANGQLMEEGVLNLEIAPREKQVVAVPYKIPEVDSGVVYHLLIRFSTANDMPWASKGHEVAWEQFELPFFQTPPCGSEDFPPVTVTEDEHHITIKGENFNYSIGKESGILESIIFDGRELLVQGPRFNVWRAPLANDLDTWGTGRTDIGQTREGMGLEIANGWRSIGLDRLVHEVDQIRTSNDSGRAEVFVEMSAHSNNYTTGFKLHYHYTVSGNGEVKLSTRVLSQGLMTHWLPKIGLQLELPGMYRHIEWFGRGPFETYPDRKTGAKIGRYKTTVEEDFVPYIIPQDYGNKTDVHWVSLTDDSGNGLYVRGDDTFNTSAQKYTTDNMARAYYPFQLKEEDVVTLNLDHKVSGVGGTAITLLNSYRVLPGDYSFTFYIRPISNMDGE